MWFGLGIKKPKLSFLQTFVFRDQNTKGDCGFSHGFWNTSTEKMRWSYSLTTQCVGASAYDGLHSWRAFPFFSLSNPYHICHPHVHSAVPVPSILSPDAQGVPKCWGLEDALTFRLSKSFVTHRTPIDSLHLFGYKTHSSWLQALRQRVLCPYLS